MARPRVVFLDQNKWIDLAKTIVHGAADGGFLHWCISGVKAGSLMLPISSSHIYESQKIQDDSRRAAIAEVMANLSCGFVFRSRSQILLVQVEKFLAERLSLSSVDHKARWFLSDNFLDSAGDAEAFGNRPNSLIERLGPISALQSYIASGAPYPAIRQFSSSSRATILSIEERRSRWKAESVEMQRRAHAATLFLENQDVILNAFDRLRINPAMLKESGGLLVRELSEKVPLLKIEQEMSLRLELEARKINENDLRDFSSFCVALSLGCDIAGEKAFVNRIRQARLQAVYGGVVTSKVADLMK